MDNREKEVLRAAHVLNDYCKSKGLGNCKSCLLYANCTTDPEHWKLPELEEPQEPEILQELELRKLKEIKTIKDSIDYERSFDERVNKAIAKGWTLVKREVIAAQTPNTKTALYAELERYDND